MNSLPWNEKYRPNKLDSITYQIETITVIKNLINKCNLPHLIFYGPPGTGKTSTILAICNEIFPDNMFDERVFEFNASSDRGIKFIRDTVKNIANLKISNRKDILPLKMIILDEVDTLTPESQFALRRIMENSSKSTRFCLICNYPNKLIDPIISRCSQFRFKPIPNTYIEKTFIEILKKEKIKNDKKITKNIVNNSYGDLRLGISYLERYYKNNEKIKNIFGVISSNKLFELFDYALTDKEKLKSLIDKYIMENYHLIFQIKPLLELVTKLSINDNIKKLLIEDLSLMDHYIILGVNNELLWNFLYLVLIKNMKIIDNN